MPTLADWIRACKQRHKETRKSRHKMLTSSDGVAMLLVALQLVLAGHCIGKEVQQHLLHMRYDAPGILANSIRQRRM